MPHRRSILSLFTGAGGLDLGLEAAGFRPCACVEVNATARETVTNNRPQWRFLESNDIADVEIDELPKLLGVPRGELALVAGGPPCQPFSKSGYWANGDTRRLLDPRSSTLKQYFEVVQAMLPDVFLLENVQGIRYKRKSEGLEQILRWVERINATSHAAYDPVVFEMNAADYGVPQVRHRVFIIGHRDGVRIEPPTPTHGGAGTDCSRERYINAWDAIGQLDSHRWDDDLNPRGKWAALLPSIPEGHNYTWHTERGGGQSLFGWRTRYWSFLLKLAKVRPSWTIQATPGPSTGPFHWRNRRLSVEELLRLQTFPSGYRVSGCHGEAVRQIGNAVPPLLAEVLGRSIRSQLMNDDTFDLLPSLRIEPRDDCPDPYPAIPVPDEFLGLTGAHAPHPGVGLGPGAAKRKT